jgi:hypothetical protein
MGTYPRLSTSGHFSSLEETLQVAEPVEALSADQLVF